jgi:Lysyl oxidase
MSKIVSPGHVLGVADLVDSAPFENGEGGRCKNDGSSTPGFLVDTGLKFNQPIGASFCTHRPRLLFSSNPNTCLLKVADGTLFLAGIFFMMWMRVGLAASPPLPDLVVRQDVLAHQWVVRDENLPADACSVMEGGIAPGVHKIVRFTVMTPNLGTADINLGDPNTHVAANDGLYEFSTCHNHYHFRHYALYQLVEPLTGHVWKAAKRGFCMLDTDPDPGYFGQPPRSPQFRDCGAIGVPGNQGISHGWADTYRFFLGGQYFVLDGGDGQPAVPPGDYVVRITVNPPFEPQAGEPCRNADRIHPGVCHQLPESNYENNVGEVQITIPDHLGKHGVGPLNGTAPLAQEPVEH